jgi:hypothetical protein
MQSTLFLFGLETVRGRLAAAERVAGDMMDAAASVGIRAVSLQIGIQLALSGAWLRGDLERALPSA